MLQGGCLGFVAATRAPFCELVDSPEVNASTPVPHWDKRIGIGVAR